MSKRSRPLPENKSQKKSREESEEKGDDKKTADAIRAHFRDENIKRVK